MKQKTISFSAFVWLLVLCSVIICGCSKSSSDPSRSSQTSSHTPAGPDPATNAPARDSTPRVLVPKADGTVTYGTDAIHLDASHTDQGYLMIQYLGDNQKVKMQIATPNGNTYTYLLSQDREYETFPLPSGDGNYGISVLENVEGDMYSVAFSQDIEVTITDEFLPFLYPNQYVNFTSSSKAIAKGQELAEGAHSDLEVVQEIYHYVTGNITYDDEKAASVAYGYLPDIDDTLSTGKGICFDYAAVMSAMLRSQNIPTKLEVGYAGEAYHAWISTYVDEIGWIDNIIEFDGSSWSLMDPTFAANTNSKDLKKFIGDGSNYVLKYSY